VVGGLGWRGGRGRGGMRRGRRGEEKGERRAPPSFVGRGDPDRKSPYRGGGRFHPPQRK